MIFIDSCVGYILPLVFTLGHGYCDISNSSGPRPQCFTIILYLIAFAASQSKCPEPSESHQSKHLTLKDEPEMIPVNKVQGLKQSVSMSILPDRIDDDDEDNRPMADLNKRRVSWAFEHPEIPECTDPSLDDIKSLLKKQIRSATETPDFIYLTVSALKNQVSSTYPYEHSGNQEFRKPAHRNLNKSLLAQRSILRNRPKSSPSSIDTKTKANISEGLAAFIEDNIDDGKSMKSGLTSAGRTTHSAKSTEKADPNCPAAGERAQSAQILRVQSAGTPRSKSADSWRLKTAKKLGQRTKKYHGLTTTATETSIVPMLMYPKDGLKPAGNTGNVKRWTSQQSIAKNHPLCSERSLKLRTYTEEVTYMAGLKTTTNKAC